MDKCRDCEHRGKGDLEKCLQCFEVAPLRVHVALLLVVLLLFFMTVLATAEALNFRQSREGPLTRLIKERISTQTPQVPPAR